MPKNLVEIEGTIVKSLPNTKFTVKLDNGKEITAIASGKIRYHYIRILPGDRVRIEFSPYDLSLGRIVYRFKKSDLIALKLQQQATTKPQAQAGRNHAPKKDDATAAKKTPGKPKSSSVKPKATKPQQAHAKITPKST